MASLNQNFTIHHLDKFSVEFSITDNLNVLNDATARGWWGVGFSASTTLATILLQRSNDSWSNNITAPNTVDDYEGLTIGASSITCDVILNDRQTSTDATQKGSKNLLPNTDPYHECVYSGAGNQGGSTVVTSGTITVLYSLFTQQGYRA